MEKVLRKMIDKHIVPNYDVLDYNVDELNDNSVRISISPASHQIRIDLNPDTEEVDVEKLDEEMKKIMSAIGFGEIKSTHYFFPNKVIYMIFATI